MNFDPMTGQPINNNNINNDNTTFQGNIQNDVVQNTPLTDQTQNQQPIAVDQQEVNVNVVNQEETPQSTIQNIPTVEQTSQNFVANTQAISTEKQSDSKAGVNYLLIIILLLVVIGAVFFLFPLLKNYI